MKDYTVYKHTSPSGKVYIGITSQELRKRWGNGRGYKYNDAFYNAIKKYGWENIKHEVLFIKLTKQEAEKEEIRLIKEYKSANKNFGYNIQNGGNCAGTHSEETKKKGFELIERELEKIPKDKVRAIAKDNIEAIKSSNRRDFRF